MHRPVKLTFKVTAADADELRSELLDKIRKSHIAIAGSYEEGIIDALAWLLGDQERPID